VSNPPLKYSPQVRAYIAALPPDAKKTFNRELGKLRRGGGDTHPLRAEFVGFHRLRIGSHRVIYRHIAGPAIECAHAGPRKTIYQAFISAQATP
jgi:mRNA-degrading endonuclease RelE of RelBE toxin-antitoxin system